MTTVYILQCANGQYYVGSTNDISERLREHQVEDGALFKGAKFTKAHLPVKLVYTEEYEDEHEARMREQQLHKWSRAKKEALIRGDIEALKQLAKGKAPLPWACRRAAGWPDMAYFGFTNRRQAESSIKRLVA